MTFRHLPFCLLVFVCGCGKSTGYWIEQTKADDPAKRLHAVHVLHGKKDSAVVVPALIESLQDENLYVRRDAARALGKFGATDAVAPLQACLNDPEPSVRKAAAQALKDIEGKLRG